MSTFSRRATLEWTGDVTRGAGHVVAGSGAFDTSATFPRIAGDPPATTTPEELLAASHATCFGIGLRSVLAQRGAAASKVRVTATITAEKAGGVIRLTSSHLEGVLEGLTGIEPSSLADVASVAEAACTISTLLRASVPVTVSVRGA